MCESRDKQGEEEGTQHIIETKDTKIIQQSGDSVNVLAAMR